MKKLFNCLLLLFVFALKIFDCGIVSLGINNKI